MKEKNKKEFLKALEKNKKAIKKYQYHKEFKNSVMKENDDTLEVKKDVKKKKKAKFTRKNMQLFLSIIIAGFITNNLFSIEYFNFSDRHEAVLTALACISFFAFLIYLACEILIVALNISRKK